MDPASILGMFDLSGRRMAITGGASGLGLAVAAGAAALGSSVVVIDRDLEAAQEAVAVLRGQGLVASCVQCDVRSHASVSSAMEEVVELLGGLDGFVASAGIGRRSPALAMTAEDWREVIDVNLTGAFYSCQAAGRYMTAEGRGGSIVVMSSVAGQIGLTTGNANYAASKGGIDALTRTLAIEWATLGVRVNAVAPTHIRTPLIETALLQDRRRQDQLVANIPMGRLGEPIDVVGAVLFLLGEAAGLITGHVLNVDGGHVVR